MSDTPTPSASVDLPTPPTASPRRWDWRPKVRWFAAEIVVVVAGVLIALALNAWWGGRQDAAREQEYLRQLVADLKQTEDTFEAMQPEWSRWDADAAKLLRSFRSDRLPPADSVLKWTGRAIDIRRPSIVTATARALVETGDLNLIRNDSLRSSITNYLDLMDQSRSERAHIDEEARPFILSMTERVDFIDGWFGGMRPGQRDTMSRQWAMSPVPEGPVRTVRALDVEALIRDPAAYTTVANLWRMRFYMSNNRGRALEATVALREQVEAELNR